MTALPIETGPRIGDIIALAADRFAITPADILGRSRARRHVLARHAVSYALRRRWHMSYPQIARAVGCSDHTSAMNGVKAAGRHMIAMPGYRAIVDELTAYNGEPFVRRKACSLAIAPPARPTEPKVPKPKRDFDSEDRDGDQRATGTKALIAAIAMHHPERIVA